ncbi:MAG: lipid-binding SYLF domain-containing protein [Rhodospirillaceae bacterium]
MPSRAIGPLRFLTFAVAIAAMALMHRPAAASDRADAEAAIAAATATVERVRADVNFKEKMDPYLARARAVMVVPHFYKGAFFIGGSYGNGVLTVRDNSGQFSAPAFFRMMGGSVGLQFGGQEARMIFMIMTDAGLEAILKDKFKFGAGAGVSFATMGANIEASTTSAVGADIIAFAQSGGAFGGGAFEGTVIEPRPEWNEAIYGSGAASRGILFDRRYPAPHSASALYHALTVNTGAPVGGGTVAPITAGPVTDGQDLPPVTIDPAPRSARGPLLVAPVETAPLDPPRQTQ